MIAARSRQSDASALAGVVRFGGAVVLAIWSLSLIAYATSGLPESHRAVTRQWIATGALFVLFAVVSYFHDAIFGWLARRMGALRVVPRTLERFAFGEVTVRTSILILAAALAALASWLAAILPPAGRIVVTLLALAAFGAVAASFANASLAAWWRRVRIDGRHAAVCAAACAAIAAQFAFVPVDYVRLAVGVVLAAFAYACAIYPLRRAFGLPTDAGSLLRFGLTTFASGAFLATAAWLALDGHRRLALLVAIAQTVALIRLRPAGERPGPRWLAIAAASVLGWLFSTSFTYTPLTDLLLAATPALALAAAGFAFAFALVVAEFESGTAPAAPRTKRASRLIALGALAIFVELSLRSDHLLTDWVPYHRLFWTGAADFVRTGGWLLWDVPSQYGFLSALSLALWPAPSTWQALYEQTALVLVADAAIIFAILRDGRSGACNAVFAGLVTVAALFTSQGARDPFGWRLYPQLGLRFNGLIALLAIAFAIHVSRARPERVRALFAAGHAVWLLSFLWSFESGVLATFLWFPFASLQTASRLEPGASPALLARRIARRFAPLAALAVAGVGAIDLYYRAHLGHGPDWAGYFEFSISYQDADVVPRPIVPHGPGWLLVVLLTALGAIAIRAFRERSQTVPIYAACFFTVWGVSTYYAGEGFNNHVNALAPVLVLVVAIVLAVERRRPHAPGLSVLHRALVMPFFVVIITTAFTDGDWPQLRAPFVGGYTFDQARNLPTAGGELAALAARAHISPRDRVIYASTIESVKLDIGLLFPFARTPSGAIVPQTAWLPISPVGPLSALVTLPYARREVYIERYFAHVHDLGWLYAYHRSVDCSRYVPRLTTGRAFRSANYAVARCIERPVRSHDRDITRSNQSKTGG